MPPTTRIDVSTPSRSYPVMIGAGILPELARVLDDAGCGARRFIVTNPTVWQCWGETIRTALPDSESIVVPDGERFKNLSSVSRIYDALLRANVDRASVLITFGGGVVSDMGGFAAATFLRGLPLVHVPTTLLAQVDASVGGKVGVNLPGGKNLVGAFYQPSLVVSDPDVLRTLPRREFRAGLYEVIKYGMACNSVLFETLQREFGPVTRRDVAALSSVIADCCRIKAEIVGSDERESGLRRVLNFGHTAGHAIEALTRYRRFLHGEAVAYGMLVAGELACARGSITSGQRDTLTGLVAQLGPLPPLRDLAASAVVERMHRDKKVHEGRLHMVLPTGIGAATIVDDVQDEELLLALTRVGMAEAD